MYERIVFVDYDGTIMSQDTLGGAMRILVPKEEYEEKEREMLSGKITLSQAIHCAFDGRPSSRVQEIVDFVMGVEIRPGFEAFLDEMEALEIPVVVISGGLRQLIEPKIGKYRDRLLGMHYVDLDTSGETMRLVSDYDDGKEVLKKTDVMALYDYKSAIGIGDSYTDFNMSRECLSREGGMVFARDILADFLKREGIPFYPWNDFYDIVEIIKSSK